MPDAPRKQFVPLAPMPAVERKGNRIIWSDPLKAWCKPEWEVGVSPRVIAVRLGAKPHNIAAAAARFGWKRPNA